MTYAMFDALVERRKSEERKEYIRTAILATAIVNFSLCAPEKKVQIEDFIPQQLVQTVAEDDLSKMAPGEAAAKIMSSAAKRTYSR